jgi:riboflavin transporter FmnP
LVAGTSILGAVVAILETSRFLRIPFPLFPLLKFDVVGIPMVFTYLFFGLPPSIVTSLVSLVIISVRNPFGGIMKCTAELATIVGAFIIFRKGKDRTSRRRKMYAVILSIMVRVIIMAIANVLFLPIFYPVFYTTLAAVAILPFTCIFNAIQGAISFFGGFLIHEAVSKRLLQDIN